MKVFPHEARDFADTVGELSPSDDDAPSYFGRYSHAIVGATSILLFVVIVCANILKSPGIDVTASILFCFASLGSAPLQVPKQQSGWRWFALGLGLGVAIVLLTGFLLIEFKVWSIGTPVFFVFGVLGLTCHAYGLIVNVRSNQPIISTAQRRSTSRTLRRTLIRSKRAIVMIALSGAVLSLESELFHTHLTPGRGGLVTSVSPFWAIGLAMMIVSIILSWSKVARLVPFTVAIFAVIFTTAPAIVYDLPRYDWTQKHVGVTELFSNLGHVLPGVDIYQTWPGFFAGIAWICHASGFSGIEQIARWWPAGVDLSGMVIVRYWGQSLGLNRNRSWVAGLLFILGNTIGQDYYSPQSIALVGFLAMSLIAFRAPRSSDKPTFVEWFVFTLLALALAVTHQLTPFVAAGEFLIAAMFGLAKSRLMPVIALIPAGVWSLFHLTTVKKYYNVGSVGHVSQNLQSPNAALGYHYTFVVHLFDVGQAAAPGLVGLLAVLALIQRRDRLSLCLAVCIASMSILVVAVHYGSEDVQRGALFALPFAALLAATGNWGSSKWINRSVVALFPLLLAAGVVGQTGLDDLYVVRPSDLAIVQDFQRIAPKKAVLIEIGGYTPIKSTPRYPFLAYSIFYPVRTDQPGGELFDQESALTQTVKSTFIRDERGGQSPHFYMVATQQSAVQLSEDGVISTRQYREMVRAFESSNHWKLIDRSSTAALLQFRD
jgi:hypothetical protein